MKVTKIEAGHYTNVFKLEGKEDRKERYINYNNILFENLEDLLDQKKQIIILNEIGNGGLVYGNMKYANNCVTILQKENPDKDIRIISRVTSENNRFAKLALSICPKPIPKTPYKI